MKPMVQWKQVVDSSTLTSTNWVWLKITTEQKLVFPSASYTSALVYQNLRHETVLPNISSPQPPHFPPTSFDPIWLIGKGPNFESSCYLRQISDTIKILLTELPNFISRESTATSQGQADEHSRRIGPRIWDSWLVPEMRMVKGGEGRIDERECLD